MNTINMITKLVINQKAWQLNSGSESSKFANIQKKKLFGKTSV